MKWTCWNYPDGPPYVVVKAGMILRGIILPYKAVNTKFVTQLETLLMDCRMEIAKEPAEGSEGEEN